MSRKKRRGAVTALVVIGLITLLGMAALTIDVGQLVIAAQTAQKVADAAALGAGAELPDHANARNVVLEMVRVNNAGTGQQVVCDPGQGDVAFWAPYETVPDAGSLGPSAWAVRVTTHVQVDYAFAPLLGLDGTTVERHATVSRMPVGGVSICPMWISHPTEYDYGQQQDMLMADGPHYADIPGNFGWLQPLSGENDLFELLRGYQVPADILAANHVSIGDTVSGTTGLRAGKFRKALESAPDGLARLQRAQHGKWADDTFGHFHSDNPRIMIVPLVEYAGGNGSNAQYEIKKFGAFWLEDVDSHGQSKSIDGRFIQYQVPGAGGDALSAETGLWTSKIVR